MYNWYQCYMESINRRPLLILLIGANLVLSIHHYYYLEWLMPGVPELTGPHLWIGSLGRGVHILLYKKGSKKNIVPSICLYVLLEQPVINHTPFKRMKWNVVHVLMMVTTFWWAVLKAYLIIFQTFQEPLTVFVSDFMQLSGEIKILMYKAFAKNVTAKMYIYILTIW